MTPYGAGGLDSTPTTLMPGCSGSASRLTAWARASERRLGKHLGDESYGMNGFLQWLELYVQPYGYNPYGG